MSAKTTTTSRKSKTLRPARRNRHNVMFTPECHARGRELAQQDHRSFGGEMEYLIDKEWNARRAMAEKAA